MTEVALLCGLWTCAGSCWLCEAVLAMKAGQKRRTAWGLQVARGDSGGASLHGAFVSRAHPASLCA